jgi:hypothetical protein
MFRNQEKIIFVGTYMGKCLKLHTHWHIWFKTKHKQNKRKYSNPFMKKLHKH